MAHTIGKAVKFGIVGTVHFRKCHGAGSGRNAGIVGDDHLSAGFQNASAFFSERLGVKPVERLRGGDVIDAVVRKMRIGGGTVYGGEMLVPRQLFFRFSPHVLTRLYRVHIVTATQKLLCKNACTGANVRENASGGDMQRVLQIRKQFRRVFGSRFGIDLAFAIKTVRVVHGGILLGF